MANTVEIVINGRDQSSAAFQTAVASATRLGREVKTMTATFSAASGVMASFGNSTLANLAAQASIAGTALEQATRAVKGVPAATLARWGIIGAAIGAATWTVSRYTEKLETQAAAEEKVGKIHDDLVARLNRIGSATDGATEAERERFRLQNEQIKLLDQEGAGVEHLIRLNEELARKANEAIEARREAGMDRIGQDLNAAQGKLLRGSNFGGGERSYSFYTPEQGKAVLAMNRELDEMLESYRRYTDDRLAIGEAMARVEEERSRRLKQMNVDFAREETKQRLSNAARWLDGFGRISGSLAQIAETSGKKGFKLAQALRYGEAVMSTAAGIARAFAEFPWPASALVAATVGAAGAAQIATIAATKGPQAHGGVDYVPQDQTVLLQEGERVIKRSQNERLMEILDGGSGGGGVYQVSIHLDGAVLGKGIGQMSRDGRLTINAKAIR